LDRLRRSLGDLIALSKTLERRGIGVEDLKAQIDTISNGGHLVLHLFVAP
jgi:DNA invertase Pin-like site-specific DNA recombinase